MAIKYTATEIIITDDNDPSRPPVILPAGASSNEVAAAAASLLPPPPPPEPPSDWLGFAGWLYQFPPIMAGMAAARQSTIPQGEPATTGLPAAMDEARLRQNYVAFALSWGQFLAASQLPAEAIAEIVAKADACNLPPEFIAALAPTRQRARNADGTFIADDPATPDVDEAWVP
jgi:hypothetical protein